MSFENLDVQDREICEAIARGVTDEELMSQFGIDADKVAQLRGAVAADMEDAVEEATEPAVEPTEEATEPTDAPAAEESVDVPVVDEEAPAEETVA